MKISSQAVLRRLFRLLALFRHNGRAPEYASEEPPLRSELFSTDQMEQYGKTLAATHKLSPRRTPDQLLARLADNEELLIRACDLLTEAVKTIRQAEVLVQKAAQIANH